MGFYGSPCSKNHYKRPLNVESATTLDDDDDDDPWAPLLLLHLLPGPNQWQLVEAKVNLLLQNWASDVLIRDVIQG
ncbi:hypothetical protein NC652_014066 [Populus alba x Populus x berolinensis]|nr:hypothetical protein NC652_014066 [Populus alba x Populus x berolinensis]